MSITGAQRISCVCGAPVEVILAESINAARHPHLRQMILDRRLHRFECGACARTLVFEKSLSYVDWNRRQFIQVAPRGELHRADELVEFTKTLFGRVFSVGPQPVRALGAEFFVRLCFGYEELREKLVAFDHQLNDLVLEALKIEVLAGEPALLQSGALTLYLDAVRDDGTLELRVERPQTGATGAANPTGAAGARTPGAAQTVVAQRALFDHLAGQYGDVLARRQRLASGPHVSLLRLLDWPKPAQAEPALAVEHRSLL